MRKNLYILIIILLCSLPVHALCEEGSGKEVWVEAVGEAVMGEFDTPKEVKHTAKMDAERNALEQAQGVFLKGHTLVSNSQVVDDLIYAAVRGRIKKVEVIEKGWDGKDRRVYRVKIKALIKPIYPEHAEGFMVKLFLSRSEFTEGDDVSFFYESSQDCFVYIFSIAMDGSVTLLFPNSSEPDNAAASNTAYEFPTKESRIRLRAMFIKGFDGTEARERVKIIATRNKEEILASGFKEGLFKVYDANSTGMISDLVKRLNRLDPADWTEADISYTLRR